VSDQQFNQWGVLELMGHRRLVGRMTEQDIAGKGFIRIDLFSAGQAEPIVSQFYNPDSVYGIHPTSEEVARAAVIQAPAPIQRWELPQSTGTPPTEAPQEGDNTGIEDDDLEETIGAESSVVKCQTCDGCGKIANDDDGTPWRAWEELPPGSDLSVKLGIIKPITCSECGGTGEIVRLHQGGSAP